VLVLLLMALAAHRRRLRRSKQPGGYPKYLVLRERLLLKLEMLLEEAARAGLPVTTFQIMSGYRTPYYNRSIGNETRYSRAR
jgi:hypothetical protein